MFLNEHQSKSLLAEVGVATPQGVQLGPDDPDDRLPRFPAPWFVKALVLAGGRGKAGGVIRARNAEELAQARRRIRGMDFSGRRAPLVRVEEAAPLRRELYLSFAVSRAQTALLLTVGREGGVDVEESFGRDPRSLLTQRVNVRTGPEPFQVRAAFFHILARDPECAADKELWRCFEQLMARLWRAVRDYGLLLLEINPLALTADARWLALDAKIEIDDSVAASKPELERFDEPLLHAPEENMARAAGLSYVALSGRVGLLGNGAGLAMAAMDLLNESGLGAANFLDIGGAADSQRIRRALAMVFDNSQVEAVFLNLFGGIVNCELVARELVAALAGSPPPKPLVARLAGNGAEAGATLLRNLGLDGVLVVSTMPQAVAGLRRALGGAASETLEEAAPLNVHFAPTRPPQGLGLGPETRVLVQGATGRAARLHTERMLVYGTRIVAGVTPFKGGQATLGVPVFDSVARAAEAEGPFDASIIFVPGAAAADAILEAAANGVPWIVCITEGIPQADMLAVRQALQGSNVRLVGPNTPGVIVPERILLGIMPVEAFSPGPVAVFSRSGTLTYEVASRLTRAGLGQSVCLGVGGDPIVGWGFRDCLELIRPCDEARAVLVLGEIGGSAEEELAEYARDSGFARPILYFIAGRTAPPGRRLGHAGAILEPGGGGAAAKMDRIRAAGGVLCQSLVDIPRMVWQTLGLG